MQHKDTRSLSEIGVLAARSSPYGLRNPQLSRGGANFAVHSSLFWRLPFINCQGVWILGWLICSPPLPSNQEIRHLPSNQEIRHEPQIGAECSQPGWLRQHCSARTWPGDWNPHPPTPKRTCYESTKNSKTGCHLSPELCWIVSKYVLSSLDIDVGPSSEIAAEWEKVLYRVWMSTEHGHGQIWILNFDPRPVLTTSCRWSLGPHQAPPITPVENICAAW